MLHLYVLTSHNSLVTDLLNSLNKLLRNMIRSIEFFLLRSIWLFYIALPVIRQSTAHIVGNETDRLALIAFKHQITKDPLGATSSWNDSLHFCDWKGVTCARRHRRVRTLNLLSQGITGSISPCIGNLSFLRSIILANNSLHGKIPQDIGRLFRLQLLHMGNNSLSGSIPVNLSHCSNLQTLGLQNNELTGKIPEEFGSLNKLISLNLQLNNLTGVIPSSFGNLSSIRTLGMGWNNLTGRIPDSLGQLKRITFLSLHLNKLSGIVPPSFYNLSTLEHISLTGNQLEGSLPRNFGLKLPNLRRIAVGDNLFSGSIPISLFANATRVQLLELTSNSFTGEVPIEVGTLKKLERLNLEINFLGSGGTDNDLGFISSLTNCSNLKLFSISYNLFGGRLPNSVTNLSVQLHTLYLGNNKISGSIPSDIGKLIKLRALSIRSNFLIGTIPKSIGMLQNLQVLLLRGNRLSGQIPYSIGNISSLFNLDLANNILAGYIAASFENFQFLNALYLDHNNLTGILPKQVLGLARQLTFADLSHNSLVGSLPLEVGNLQNLILLDLSDNSINGEIPSTLGNCLSLQELYLQGNFIQGVVPSSFGGLKGIEDIDLSRNNLSGNIPKLLENLGALESLNLSFNNFEGDVPIRGIFENVSAYSIGGNSNLCGGVTELHLPKCPIQMSKKKEMSLALKVILGVLLPLLSISFLFLAFCLKQKRRANLSSKLFWKSSLQRISYNELRQATNGFSPQNLIGTGNFGSVYKGVLNRDESIIAVKVLNLMERGASKSFMAECEVLRKVRHRNLLKIKTVCASIDFEGNDFKALVFEFITNGSLESWLHRSSSDRSRRPSRNLNLIQRLNIAIDVASALDYLHSYCPTPIVHCDLKPSNILLNDHIVAYVADFGLAKFLHGNTSISIESETSSMGVRGTLGYIPPEYGMGAEVSTQGDVYSYGIMLLEMFTGKRPTDAMFDDSLNLHNFCKVNLTVGLMNILDTCFVLQEIPNGDNGVEEQICMTDRMRECLTSVLEIGVACSSHSAVDRMSISEVLKKLHMHKEVIVGIQDHGEM